MKRKIKDFKIFLTKINDTQKIKEKCLALHPADLSLVFHSLDYDLRTKIYNALNDEELAILFSYLDEPSEYLSEFDADKVSRILENMEVDDASNILSEILDEDIKKTYLKKLSKEKQEDLEYISKIEEDKVGSIITTNYIEVESGIDVKEAMKKLIKEADEFELIDPIFVTKNGLLVGTISLNDLIIARSPKVIDEIMDASPISIDINESISKATNMIRNYGLLALPVVDNKKLVGIITSDDVFEIMSDAADTKYANLAGVSTDDLGDQRFFKRLLERLPWLLILLALSFITTNVMGAFEGVIQKVAILVFFQTLIFDMAGNVGTQSLAVTIQRIIHNDNFTPKDVKKHIFKEFRINLINSIFLMIIAFIITFVFVTIYDNTYSASKIGLIISLSIGISILFSSIFGSLFPIILSKLKINPAVAGGPLITTVNDVVSIVIYFSLAALLLNIGL